MFKYVVSYVLIFFKWNEKMRKFLTFFSVRDVLLKNCDVISVQIYFMLCISLKNEYI